MKRIMLKISYDGTNYSGWQTQPNAVTVEEIIDRELSKVLNEEIHVIGASRTDSGVHALSNVCVFDTDSPIPGDKFSYVLNKSLPEDIIVQASMEVAPDFHPRHCNSVKTYEYRIWNATFPLAVNVRYTHHVFAALDIEAMRKGAAYLIGEHDFTSFCSVGAQVESKVRNIHSIEIIKDGALVTIRVRGGGFLYNMVRIIAGTLLQVGLGAKEPEYVKAALEALDRNAAGPTAPAKGLTLIGIEYENQ